MVQQPQIILLKEGTDTSQGKAQLISNINACVAVVDAVRTTLGPRGMDKLIHTDRVTFCWPFNSTSTSPLKAEQEKLLQLPFLLCSGCHNLK